MKMHEKAQVIKNEIDNLKIKMDSLEKELTLLVNSPSEELLLKSLLGKLKEFRLNTDRMMRICNFWDEYIIDYVTGCYVSSTMRESDMFNGNFWDRPFALDSFKNVGFNFYQTGFEIGKQEVFDIFPLIDAIKSSNSVVRTFITRISREEHVKLSHEEALELIELYILWFNSKYITEE